MLATVLGALAAYVLGLVLHELTHAVACWYHDAPIHNVAVGLHRVSIRYDPPGVRADRQIRAAPFAGVFVLAVAAGLWFAVDPTLWRVLASFSLLAGYLPRSRTDIQPIVVWYRTIAGQTQNF